ncbi:MAG: helix-turn-helix domain-containing protein [Sphingomonadales bacterium]
MTPKALINDALRLIRLYWGLSQSQLAETIGVSQSFISDIEANRKSVSYDLLQKYSQGLNIRMSQLLFFAEEISGENVKRKGNLLFADRILALLEKIRPSVDDEKEEKESN